MTYSRVFVAVFAAVWLAACSSNPASEQAEDESPESAEGSLFSTAQDYNRSALEIPPDLLQSAGERVQANAAGAAAGPERVLPPIIGASIHSDTGKSWLEIDADAETVWKKLTEFWALQEIDLVEYQPQAGIMATDWFAKKPNRSGSQAISAIAVDLLNALVSRRTAVDKFTLRLERDGDDGARTKIFVTHRAREKVAQELDDIDKTVEFNWVERDEDPEKIAQLLQTIVLLFDAGAAESADESADESAANPDNESTDQDAGESADESAGETVDEPIDAPVDDGADAPA